MVKALKCDVEIEYSTGEFCTQCNVIGENEKDCVWEAVSASFTCDSLSFKGGKNPDKDGIYHLRGTNFGRTAGEKTAIVEFTVMVTSSKNARWDNVSSEWNVWWDNVSSIPTDWTPVVLSKGETP